MAGTAWLLNDSNPGDIEIPIPDDPKGDDGFDTFWENHLGPMQVFFPINGAQFEEPTDDEKTIMEREQRLSPKQALDAFAAAELPMLMNPLSVFKLEGFADAPDDEDANLKLSEERALTVARYLQAILGTAWTKDEPLEIDKGLGGSVPAPGEDPQRISIRGQGEVSGSGDYDQADRRVDLYCRMTSPEDKKGQEKPIRELNKKNADLRIQLNRGTK